MSNNITANKSAKKEFAQKKQRKNKRVHKKLLSL